MLELFPVAARRGVTLGCKVQAFHCAASLAAEHRPGGAWASVVVARGLRRSAACGSCVWDLPGSGIKPMSPELAGDSYPLRHQGGSKNVSKHHNSLV